LLATHSFSVLARIASFARDDGMIKD